MLMVKKLQTLIPHTRSKFKQIINERDSSRNDIKISKEWASRNHIYSCRYI